MAYQQNGHPQQPLFPQQQMQQPQGQPFYAPPTVAVPVQPLFGGADVSKWDGTPQGGQGSLIPTRGEEQAATAEEKPAAWSAITSI